MRKLMLFILLVSALLLAACTPEAVVETVVVTEKEEVIVTQEVEVPAARTEIRFSGWAANPQETALLESLLYRFSVAYPDITVKYEPITGDYMQTINTLVATGDLVLVFYQDTAFEAVSGQQWIIHVAEIESEALRWKRQAKKISRYRRMAVPREVDREAVRTVRPGDGPARVPAAAAAEKSAAESGKASAAGEGEEKGIL